ncbi:MAG: sugar kinase [Planctomycetota bacterium]|nr:MAG: sugar kinase [Planctomycetota bacterium]
MSLLVTGTVGIDTVETPHGTANDVLGGSACYFSLAASLLTPVRLVCVVGEDFPEKFRNLFANRPIDLAGMETRAGSKTFRWHGRYVGDMNHAETLRTDLNVVAEAPPKIPEAFRDTGYVFLANTHPAIQRRFIEQLRSPKLIVCDTMNLWINEFRDDLVKTLSAVDGVVLNDGEARLLTGQTDLIRAGLDVIKMGPTFVVIKKGEHGAMLVSPDEVFVLPAFPTANVKDPTGAGDSFAAGMMGHLAAIDRIDAGAMKGAMARGACMASITIESFSLDSILAAKRETLDARLTKYKQMLSFD